jgi:hypothetical protein
MLIVRLNEPDSPIAHGNPSPNDPWLKAVAARHWPQRADQLDELIVQVITRAIGKREPPLGERYWPGATATPMRFPTFEEEHAPPRIFWQLTGALEFVGDIDIRSSDAAVFYSLTTHDEWRHAAWEFFRKNRIDPDAAFRHRGGVRLLRAIAPSA